MSELMLALEQIEKEKGIAILPKEKQEDFINQIFKDIED